MPHPRNYLRVRGEYSFQQGPKSRSRELPPRARRILNKIKNMWGDIVNYLRVRGEYWNQVAVEYFRAELPPRARRIQTPTPCFTSHYGTTSACAENTLRNWPLDTQLGNYLRVRGEYSHSPSKPPYRGELPPRARRIRAGASSMLPVKGTTSACAENT